MPNPFTEAEKTDLRTKIMFANFQNDGAIPLLQDPGPVHPEFFFSAAAGQMDVKYEAAADQCVGMCLRLRSTQTSLVHFLWSFRLN